jgi:hypothetical protein
VLLAEPALVPEALAGIPVEEVRHPGLRRLYEGLAKLHQDGREPSLDALRPELDHPRLAQKAMELQEAGRASTDRVTWLNKVLKAFRDRRASTLTQELHSQLQAASDPAAAMELLRRLQNRTTERAPGSAPAGGWAGVSTPTFPPPDAGARS